MGQPKVQPLQTVLNLRGLQPQVGGGSGDIAPLGLQGLGEQLALLGIQPGREGMPFGRGIFWRGGCGGVGGRTW